MDANAVIQAFDELKGNVDNDHDSLQEIVEELHNLRDAINQISNDLNTEINRATTKENEMGTTFTEQINKKANSTELDTVKSKVVELKQRIDTLESNKQA